MFERSFIASRLKSEIPYVHKNYNVLLNEIKLNLLWFTRNFIYTFHDCFQSFLVEIVNYYSEIVLADI